MRICLYTESALPMMGGQEYVVDALARQYLQLGHEPVVLAPPPRRPLAAADAGLPYPVIRHPRFVSKRHCITWYAWWLMRLHRRHGFEMLHCHSVYPTGFLASLCKHQLGVPVVITSHGGDIEPGNPRLASRQLRGRYAAALAEADALIAISPFTQQAYRNLHPAAGPIVRIPNGVDLDRYAMPAPRPAGLDPAIAPGQYVLFLGRLDARKGVDVLLNALRRLPDSRQVRLVVAGGGLQSDVLQDAACELGLARQVRFLGPVTGDCKAWLLQNCLCTVMPSRGWEGFPLVLLESFAAARPMIATRIPGLERLVDDGRTGWLVTPDSPADLAAALQKVLDQPQLADVLGRQARQAAQKYSWRSIAQQHIELYQSLLGREQLSRAA